MNREVVVFIHGVQPDKSVGSHSGDYNSLWHGVLAKVADVAAWKGALRVDVEWGWCQPQTAVPQAHEALSRAQAALGSRAFAELASASDFTLNPLRLAVNAFRPLMFYGFGDMFYYVSEDGKYSVRESVARQILDAIGTPAPDENISLTLLGHSAGSVIAFDFLFALFYADDAGFPHDYFNAAALALDEHEQLKKVGLICGLEMLRDLHRQQRLRVRRLVTFGSPISMLACRSNAVVELLGEGRKLEPAAHGLTLDPAPFGPPLLGPRWINIWDKDDPISWPVEPLMAHAEVAGHGGAGVKAPAVADRYIDVSDSPTRAHSEYWKNADVHSAIADAW